MEDEGEAELKEDDGSDDGGGKLGAVDQGMGARTRARKESLE